MLLDIQKLQRICRCRDRKNTYSNGALKRERSGAQVRLWQALCVLCPFVPVDDIDEALRSVWQMLLVGAESSP